MKPYLEDDIVCQCCGNKDKSQFSEKFHQKNLIILQCNNCEFIFIPWYYRKSISYENYKGEDVLNQIRKGNDWLKVQRHLLRFKLIRKYIKSGKLFDLGAGWGHFLLAGKQLGYDVYGIEISKYPYIYAKEDLKLPVDHIDFFEMPPQKFDVITLWDVLEHIDQADTFVKKCAEMTNPGGYIVLQVPQIDSFIAKRMKENWKMMGLDHVNYFSKKTITRILNNNGYEVKKIKSSIELKLLLMYTILPWIKKMRNKNASNSTISSSQRQEYFNKTTNRPKWMLKIMVGIHNIIYNFLSFINVGEEMIVVAQKK
ncbi:MAG: class I SAM-dependent methyltransferase [Bacteroidia bacterium]|jgi:2-polyprenyl-3-methyl-5-hydroxy-6-metoxy-1,4-benzoquinol methylase|nr:class I SAM-dependent methyltransferase [Bacteroidia bacterium]